MNKKTNAPMSSGFGRNKARLMRLALLVLSAIFATRTARAEQLPPPAGRIVRFDSDIRPVLEEHCIRCHNPEKKKGGLRLDAGKLALEGGLSGPVILPGNSAGSLLIHNISGLEDAYLMPPEGDMLSDETIGLFRAWIDQGAEWPESGETAEEQVHWSFVPPVRPAPPEPKDPAWRRNPIDRFIASRLESEGLAPSAPTRPEKLLRRLSLDLTGLPPTVGELDEYQGAPEDPDRTNAAADRLLASPRYGERWARWWLDAARYADTNGYEKDRERSMWPWRDWVIGAFNDNMPFDEFTIEQLAGDLLPDATISQKIATGFHRNTMINEEGGVDVEQFRYESVVDRVGTTATVFLGLTLSCAQCHNHKYDPISQKEFFEVFAFLNDADEPVMPVPDSRIAWERMKKQAEIDALIAELAGKFPPFSETMTWTAMRPLNFSSQGGALIEAADPASADADRGLRVTGFRPAKDVTTVLAVPPEGRLEYISVEALADPQLPGGGPGRADNGNFVLSGIEVALVRAGNSEAGPSSEPLRIAEATADFNQAGFGVADSIDDNPGGGWGIAPQTGRTHRAIFKLAEAVGINAADRLLIRLAQEHGAYHTLGSFRLLGGRTEREKHNPALSDADQRARHLEARFGSWLEETAARSSEWRITPPASVVSTGGATMDVLDDGSVLVSGDRPNRDIYESEIDAADGSDGARITALRIEALPHESLPESGPGRDSVYQPGNFQLNEVTVEILRKGTTSAERVGVARATADFEQPNHGASLAIDGDRATGWSVNGEQGRPHALVVELSEAVRPAPGDLLRVTLDQNFIHQETLGRFRISITDRAAPVTASGLIAELEAAALLPAAERGADLTNALRTHFLMTTPELKAEQKKIERLVRNLPRHPTTLVMEGRGAPRPTHIHHRGEYLNPGEEVSPAVPDILHIMEDSVEPERLRFARWITDRRNPLTARVIMNRVWQEIFGAGLVRTSEDFGTQGDPPTHPELLDWLAVEFMESGWDLKHMIRLIVTSRTYRQRSDITPELLARDPENRLLARGPRFRVTAEMVRDIALLASGLLSDGIGGPSVFPPQPAGVSELSYGPLAWNESKGEDRYRRGLYTFLKRTSPYPMLTLFDAPNSDTACVRRVRSNTPLQSLTLLNDEVFVEAARALAAAVIADSSAGDSDADRVNGIYRRVLSRKAEPAEADRIIAFVSTQLGRFGSGELDPAKFIGTGSPDDATEGERAELAAWTAAARAVLNLDETITKE